ncbi:MAG: hypothetical protein WKG00_03705 [Polyangiaceae bacterium]
MEVLALRRTAPFDLVRPLATSSDAALSRAAARALASSGSRDEAVELLDAVLARATDDGVFLAAAESAMQRGHVPARGVLRAQLPPGAAPARAEAAAVLLCLGGHESDLESLLAVVATAPSARLARALGRFGHASSLPALIGLLGSGDEALVEAAGEALDRITAAGLREVVEEPWEVDMPPELASFASIPVPTRKVEKVIVDPARWDAWLRAHAAELDPAVRLRAGRPWTPMAIVDELEARNTPPPRREEALLELSIALGHAVPLRVDDWVARQQGHLAELRSAVGRVGVRAGTWAFGADRQHSAPAPPPAPSAKLLKATMAFTLPTAAGAALPFRAGASSPPPASTAAPAGKAPRVGATTAPSETAPRPVLPFRGAGPAPAAAAGAAFPPGGPSRAPSLSLEQYAWLYVLRKAEPGRAAETLASMGLGSDAAWSACSAAWDERLTSDPSARQRWLELVAHYRGLR